MNVCSWFCQTTCTNDAISIIVLMENTLSGELARAQISKPLFTIKRRSESVQFKGKLRLGSTTTIIFS